MNYSLERDLAAVKKALAKIPHSRYSTKTGRTKRNVSSPAYAHWQAAKTRAKQKGLNFDITLEDIVIPEFCPVLGIKLDPSSVYTRPELDRKDVNKGYVKGNIFIISGRANRLKMNATLDEIRAISKYALS